MSKAGKKKEENYQNIVENHSVSPVRIFHTTVIIRRIVRELYVYIDFFFFFIYKKNHEAFLKLYRIRGRAKGGAVCYITENDETAEFGCEEARII